MAWFASRKIATKIFICFGWVIAVGLLTGAVTFRNLAQLEDSQTWTLHTYRVKEVTSAMLGRVLRRDDALQTYLLTRDPRLLEEVHALGDALQPDLRILRSLTSDNRSQQTRLAILGGLLGIRRGEIDSIVAAAQKGELRKSESFSAILQSLRDVATEEDGLLARRMQSEAGAFQAVYWANALGPLAALAIAIFVGGLLHRTIAQPVANLTASMRRIAKGDLEIEIVNSNGKEEIGEMSRALMLFRDDMIEGRRLRKERQDVRLRGKRERLALMGSMADRFEAVVGSIVQAVSASTAQMQSSAGSLLDMAELTSGQVKAVNESTKTASATMQEVAGGTRKLLDSVGEINARMGHSAEVAGQAVAEAERTTATIEGLSQSMKRIGAIADLINDVARQTNLLALNATIEAARAGDAGRGFAVVATEVKALADQTASATADIRRQIEGIQAMAGSSVAGIEQIGRTIAEMAKATKELSIAGGAQGEATRDLVDGMRASAQVTEDVSARLGQVSEGAVTTGTAAMKMLSAANDLARQAARLREEAHKFATSVRAGA